MAEYEYISEIKCSKCGYDGFNDDVDFWSDYMIASMGDNETKSVACPKCQEWIEIVASENIIVTFSNHKE